MRNGFVACLVLLALAPVGFAQQYPYPYPPAGVQPAPCYPYSQAQGAQVQPAQYPYGNYNAPVPVYTNPQRPVYAAPYAYANAYGYNNGYGVNYYYVQNPYGSYQPTYYRPPVAQPVAPQYWPEPSQPLPPLPDAQEEAPGVPLEGEVEAEAPAPAPGCGINFHRPTCECFWFAPGYSATFLRPMHMNGPLVTTGSAGDTIPGALGQPGTLALFGDKSVDFGLFSGVRAELGIFLDRENRFSLELDGFYLLQNTSNFFMSADQNGNPVISRPYFNVADGFYEQFRLANSAPGQLTGSIAVDMRSQMAGLELNGRFHSYVQDRYHFDFLGGLRYLRLDETLQTREQVNALPGTQIPFQGGTFNPPDYDVDQDTFHTINQFIGPQVGARLSWEERWFTLSAFAKLALGATLEHADIGGNTTLVVPGQGTQSAAGGVLALPSNSGSFDRTIFGVVPEIGLDFKVNITQNICLNFGYSFLYWNHVDRPGSQYNLNINPNQIPSSFFYGATTGPAAPAHRFNDEVFWTNSFNLGLEVHF